MRICERKDRDMARPPDQLRLGYDVDENAVRFSNYFHLLRELVHLSCGWLPLAPQFEVKYALGDHLHVASTSSATRATIPALPRRRWGR
jgi:hypothetical protein